jgi:PAS domain S-box-containing protein
MIRNVGPADGGQNLFESERRFKLLVEGVVDYAIYMLDPQGIVSNWNAGAERIKGYKRHEIIGQHFSLFYSEDDREAGIPTRSLETARREGKFSAEGWRVRKDGTKFLASVVIDAIYDDGKLIGFAKITRDISEQSQAKAALHESESKFRLLVNGVTDYALYMLDPTGIVANWNAGGQRIKGYSSEEIVGQHFSRFYSDADRAAGRPARALEIAKTAGRYEEEGWRVRKDGSFFWASVVIDPIRNEVGDLLGFAKITRDISERREAQLKLEKVQRQLAESQKMDALGQLTGGVAHDFNNLLMIVGGNIHTLKKIVAGDPKGQRAALAIETAAQRGAALTRQLLTFARRQNVNPVSIDVTERVASIYQVVSSGLGDAVTIQTDSVPDVWPVTVDVSEFDTALLNLIINARDATKEGTVTIRAENKLLTGEPHGDFVAISVADTGQGIPQDVIDKIFDPFFTTKPPGKGTGLGLSQVHGFAHQAGGTISVKSELGKGTTVTLYLPRALKQHEANEEETSTVGAGVVLLVEDNPDVADASTNLLEQLGYSVRSVNNAESALEEVERGCIDLVFSDIVMPGPMDGLGLAKILRERHPNLPLLLTTGYSDNVLNSGFPVLRKPFQIHELSRALAKIKSD